MQAVVRRSPAPSSVCRINTDVFLFRYYSFSFSLWVAPTEHGLVVHKPVRHVMRGWLNVQYIHLSNRLGMKSLRHSNVIT